MLHSVVSARAASSFSFLAQDDGNVLPPGGVFAPGGATSTSGAPYRSTRLKKQSTSDPIDMRNLMNASSTDLQADPLRRKLPKVPVYPGYELVRTFGRSVDVPPPNFDVDNNDTLGLESTNVNLLSKKDANSPSLDKMRSRVVDMIGQTGWEGSTITRGNNGVKVTDINTVNIYHYMLDTFMESRSVVYQHEPWGGEGEDCGEGGSGTTQPPPPLPWTLEYTPRQIFINEVVKMTIPHTTTVTDCTGCDAYGTVPCIECLGRGRVQCRLCSGAWPHSPTSDISHHQSSEPDGWHQKLIRRLSTAAPQVFPDDSAARKECDECESTGTNKCQMCGGEKIMVCSMCEGNKKLRCFMQLIIKLLTVSDHTSTEALHVEVPEDAKKDNNRLLIYDEFKQHASPMTNFDVEDICYHSKRLLERHLEQSVNQHIILQRQQVLQTTVYRVKFTWRKDNYDMFCWGESYQHSTVSPELPKPSRKHSLTCGIL